MAGEWKYAQATFDPTLGNARAALADLIHNFLVQAVWELTSWSPGDLGDDLSDENGNRYFTRSDHGTSDIWHFDGDGQVQKCGLAFTWSGAATRFYVVPFLENLAGDGYQRIANTTNSGIYFNYAVAGANPCELLLIGGEDGFYAELGYNGIPNNVAHGMVVTHQVWPWLNGTRGPERKSTTQGIGMDFDGAIPFSNDRNWRMVLDDGLNTNITGGLRPWVVRGVSSIRSAVVPTDDRRVWIGSIDSYMSHSCLGPYGSSPTYTRYTKFHFALFSAPWDDRWPLSQMICAQTEETVLNAVSSSSSSNNVAASTHYSTDFFPFREALRYCPKFVVAGHLLTPWQLITDSDSGKEYRIVQGDDDGRNFNLGVEWPGVGNEVTI